MLPLLLAAAAMAEAAQGAPKIHEVSSPPARASVQDFPPDAPTATGPHGTSGEVQDDRTGYATLLSGAVDPQWRMVTIAVAHPSISAGSAVEITALDSGRTIVALVVGREAEGGVVALSPGAAQALGIGDHAAVRVRAVVASPQDLMALRSGRAAAARLDAPPALLVALRRRLPMRPSAPEKTPERAPISPTKATARPIAPAATRPAPRASGAFAVQVAALSSAERARALATHLGGHVVPLGRLFRVQLGPFADKAAAQRARDAAARRGYGDAQIVHND